ncbi:MAG: DoxX family protein [Asticcacaulis sp.]
MISAILNRISKLIPEALIALLMRGGVAAVFFLSGRTKVEGLLTLKDSTFYLFAEEYKVPFLPTELAAYLATYAEHILPILLILGLGTRFAAVGLLGMTMVIQLFVYPDAWSTHLGWSAMLVYLIGRGPGAISLDALFGFEPSHHR